MITVDAMNKAGGELAESGASPPLSPSRPFWKWLKRIVLLLVVLWCGRMLWRTFGPAAPVVVAPAAVTTAGVVATAAVRSVVGAPVGGKDKAARVVSVAWVSGSRLGLVIDGKVFRAESGSAIDGVDVGLLGADFADVRHDGVSRRIFLEFPESQRAGGSIRDRPAGRGDEAAGRSRGRNSVAGPMENGGDDDRNTRDAVGRPR